MSVHHHRGVGVGMGGEARLLGDIVYSARSIGFSISGNTSSYLDHTYTVSL